MADQKQAPERKFPDWIGVGKGYCGFSNIDAVEGNSCRYVRKDLHDALAKQLDELAQKLEQADERITFTERAADKAIRERDQALAQAAAAAIDMRERAADACANPERKTAVAWRSDGKPSKNDECGHGRWMYEDCEDCSLDAIHALPISPDQQQALDAALAKSWDRGYSVGYVDGEQRVDCESDNPYWKDA